MRCYICDREDDLITYDEHYGCFNPCKQCEDVIADCLADFEEEPVGDIT